jgi:hypothetical protein
MRPDEPPAPLPRPTVLRVLGVFVGGGLLLLLEWDLILDLLDLRPAEYLAFTRQAVATVACTIALLVLVIGRRQGRRVGDRLRPDLLFVVAAGTVLWWSAVEPSPVLPRIVAGCYLALAVVASWLRMRP